MEDEDKKDNIPQDEDEDAERKPNDPHEESAEEAAKEKGEGISGAVEGIHGGLEVVEMGPVVKESFLDYAMSVIVARALPDAKDGFKPVQRRIVYGMAVSGNTPDKPFKKSARIVGDVMGKYHPHGDSAIYGAMATLAQDFATRYPLVEGHGNYGSQDGDEPAAYRYTEARLSKTAMEMVRDIGKDTVDFTDTYDGEGKEPVVLPAKIPNLIVNGGTGIAVGMATKIPPHNLKETIDAVQALIKNPELSPADLMTYIKGPDFPGGGVVMGRTGIRKYFETGVGTLIVRGKYNTDTDKNGRTTITFTEIPYMVNKKELAKKIMDLCDDKIIEGIASVSDYSSDQRGTCFQIDLKKGAIPELVVSHLFKYTRLQDTFPVNMLALDNGAPKVLNMKQALSIFIKFQEEIVTRRTKYDLGKARDRVHIIQALQIVHDNIDEVVDIIKTSPNSDVAATRLTERFGFDDVQNKAVLDTTLKRLTGLETTKLSDERAQLEADILRYSGILNNFDTLKQVVLDELEETKNKFGDERRTEISNGIYSLEDEDLIADEEILIMLTESGYIKRITPDSFREQNRGGIGVIGMATKEDDVVQFMIHSRTKTDVLFFTNKGKVFRSRGYEIPEGTRTSKGIPAVNFIRLEDGEKILSIISAKEYDDKHFLFFTTEKGIVKRTVTKEFDNINSNGKIAIGLKDGDMLLDVKLTDGNALITLGASNGKACTFHESDVRAMGRTAAGVIGMNLDGAKVIDVCTNQGGKDILTLSEKGFGKRSPYSDFRLTSRGSKGVLALKMSDKTGALVALKAVEDDNDIVIITDAGTVMKTRVGDIHEAGRNTLGVKVITLRDKENISSVAIEPSEKDYEAQEAPAGDAANPEATEEDTEKLLYEQEKAHDVDDEDDDSSKGDNSKDDE